MKSLTVGEFKTQFADVVRDIQNGHPIVITYGKKRTKLAVLIPYDQYMHVTERRLGILQDKASYHLQDDFKMTDEEFLTT
jgi:prevent-host-death family protein